MENQDRNKSDVVNSEDAIKAATNETPNTSSSSITNTSASKEHKLDYEVGESIAKKRHAVPIIIAAVIVVVIAILIIVTGGFGLMGPAVKASVDDYSWDELSEISEKISQASNETDALNIAKKYNLTNSEGMLDGTQSKRIMQNDGNENWVQIAGFWHDEKTNGDHAGITFIFEKAIHAHDMNDVSMNEGGWEDSAMRSWLESEGMDLLPSDLTEHIQEVEKLTNNTGLSNEESSVTKTADKLWLYSNVELLGDVNTSNDYAEEVAQNVINQEGAQYKLFIDTGVSLDQQNDILIKYILHVPWPWWERSPDPFNYSQFLGVGTTGCPMIDWSVYETYGIVPGFCI